MDYLMPMCAKGLQSAWFLGMFFVQLRIAPQNPKTHL
jgi:hypothetical protein